ncbi:hypothetical protein FDECE_5763 [Fusarium decemcellulare]|nr:hypothetical protein FDECE_5763 [Fusarium decemcellulare]
MVKTKEHKSPGSEANTGSPFLPLKKELDDELDGQQPVETVSRQLEDIKAEPNGDVATGGAAARHGVVVLLKRASGPTMNGEMLSGEEFSWVDDGTEFKQTSESDETLWEIDGTIIQDLDTQESSRQRSLSMLQHRGRGSLIMRRMWHECLEGTDGPLPPMTRMIARTGTYITMVPAGMVGPGQWDDILQQAYAPLNRTAQQNEERKRRWDQRG